MLIGLWYCKRRCQTIWKIRYFSGACGDASILSNELYIIMTHVWYETDTRLSTFLNKKATQTFIIRSNNKKDRLNNIWCKKLHRAGVLQISFISYTRKNVKLHSIRGYTTNTKLKNLDTQKDLDTQNNLINTNEVDDNDNLSKKKLENKIKVFFNYKDILNFKLFINRVQQNIRPKINYMLLIKVRYKQHDYLTLDRQARFFFDDYKSKKVFNDLNTFIIRKIQLFSIEYSFRSQNQEIELSFREILYLPNKPHKLSKDYKELIDNKMYQEITKQLTIFDDSLEEHVRDTDVTIDNGKVINLKLDLFEEPVDFIKNLEDRNKILRTEDRIDINKNLDNSTFGQKLLANTPIIIKVDKISENEVSKYAFSEEGKLLSNVNFERLSDGNIKRSWKDNSVILNNDKVIFRSKSFKFDPIKLELYNKNKKITPLPESKIGSFDMEVFIQDSKSIIYALGFYSYLDDKPNMFYINRKLDSKQNVLACLDEMFKPKYKVVTGYSHNAGRYDSRILLKILYDYNNVIKEYNKTITGYNNVIKKYNKLVLTLNNIFNVTILKQEELSNFVNNNKNVANYNKKVDKFNKKLNDKLEFMPMKLLEERLVDTTHLFDIKTTFRKTSILRLDISKKVGETIHTISICDSYALLPDSLKKLAKNYQVDTLKGDFPHEFANDKTIFYIGNTPDISFYDKIDQEVYNTLYSDTWDFKQESLNYLQKDLISLYQIIDAANKSLHSNFNVQIVNCLTVSRLATDIYLKNYVNNNISNIPYVNNVNIFDYLHQAYYGGITEVYIPIFFIKKKNEQS